MCDHESAVDARVGNQEAGQSASAGHQSVDASLGDVGEFAHGDGEEVDGQCDGLAVEVAGRDDKVVVRADGGVVGGRVDFDVYDGADIADGVFDGSVYLWHAPEGVRVLDVCLDVVDELATLKQLAHAAGSLYLSEVRTHGMHGMCERLDASVEGVE